MSKGVSAPWGLFARIVPVLAFVACSGDDPQVPTKLEVPSVQTLTGIVGQVATPAPSVTLKDQKGRGIPNVWVKWSPSAGKVTNDSSKTDANGLASAGAWTLGPLAGTQTLTATASGLPPAGFTATAAPGTVAALNVINTVPSGVVGSEVATPPSVRAVDSFGNAIPNVAITFAVTSGAGSITGAQQVTNATGVATVGSWKLGTIAGTQSLRADAAATGTTAIINATAFGGAPVDLVVVDGSSQTGSANKRLCTSPGVIVRDAYGNGVGSVAVTFTPGTGSGSVDVTTVQSTTSGTATVGSWVLGGAATQTLIATSAALPGKQVSFTATLVPAANFGICARFIGSGGTPRQRLAVTRAVARWQSVIVGHVQTTRLNTGLQKCFLTQPVINEDVEDLLLFVELADIDGPLQIVGRAGPCAVHLPSYLTLMGYLQLDVADLDLMLNEGTLDNAVLHEIGHILGIGTLWGQITSTFSRNLLTGGGGSDPFFIGAVARDQFALSLSNYTGTPVPVENCIALNGTPIPGCKDGTRDAHWRKSVFNNELMQGYVAPTMPMSKITIGSLADLGYTVDLNAADAFSFQSALRAPGSVETPGIQMLNDIADTPIWGVEKNGTKRLLRSPINPLKFY